MEKDVGKINKNETTDVVVRVDDFGGRKGLTVREFVTSDRYTGFTKQGVRILARDFPKFKEMINSITDEDMAEVSSEGSQDAEVKEEDKKQQKLGGKKAARGSKVKEELPDY